VRIDATASVVRSAVWDDVTIGARAELIDCVVCDGAHVPAGARYRQCAIVPGATRGPEPGERLEGDLLIRDI
jgi:NDP-sugar pyrophosphorylase family protein